MSPTGFGPVEPGGPQAPAFAVAGPATIPVAADRTGSGAFTVSNVSGRAVRARLLVEAGAGARPEWFTVRGESERSLDLDATTSVEVGLSIPEDAAPGAYTVVLSAALENAPDRVVSGPTASFTVPEASRRRFPWWAVVVAGAAVLVLLVGGGAIWWFTRAPSAPELLSAPRIEGVPEVGTQLVAVSGAWDPEEVTRAVVWQVCPPETTAETAEDACTAIEIPAEEGSQQAQGASYVVAAELEGQRLRVVETAIRVSDAELGDPDLDLSTLPRTSAASALTAPVAPQPVEVAAVPDVSGLTYVEAQEVLAEAGFQIVRESTGETGGCYPTVEDQNPRGGVRAETGTTVAVEIDDWQFWRCGIVTIPVPVPTDVHVDPAG